MAKEYGTVTCSICGKPIRYKVDPKYVRRDGLDPNRLVYIRRHWARHHPKAWRESVRRGARTRARRRKSLGARLLKGY